MIETRLLIFLGVILFLSILEMFFSYEKRTLTRKQRWPSNIGMILISNLLLKIIFPLGLTSVALFVEEKDLGFFNVIKINENTEILISLMALDFFIYWQHVVTHKINFLWRFHLVHHTDLDLDFTSALRFHPLEMILSFIYKLLIVIVFGLSATSIFLFEIILSTMALFNHSNINVPIKIDKYLRLFIVTPRMHLVHHSEDQIESDKNFGFNLSLWDFIFKTYLKDKRKKTGQQKYRKASDQKLISLLLLPFKKQ